MTEPEHHRNGATSDAKVLLVREVRMFTAAVGAPVVILLLLMWGCYQVIKPNADKMTDSHSGLIESVSESLKASSDAQLESSKAVRELQIQDAQKLIKLQEIHQDVIATKAAVQDTKVKQ